MPLAVALQVRRSDVAGVSWVASTAALFELDETVPAAAGDDAANARWWPLPDDVDELAATLESEGGLYEAHRPLLRQALEHLAR